MKQVYNYHTHTYRCGHAVGEDEEYVKAAIKAGYKTLGFSDHAPYRDFPNKKTHMDFEEFDEYVSSINLLKEKYKGIIDIKVGIESEYYPDYMKEKEELRSKLNYMILGQHFINPDGTGSYFKTNSDEEIMIYADSVCKAMDTHFFDYLCHPDVFMNRQEVFNDTCKKAAHMIGEKAAETDTPLEINIHGVTRGPHEFKEGIRYFYPFKEFWQIIAEYPVRVLIGVDAHDPAQLLDEYSYNEALKQVEDFGLNFIKEPFIQ